MSEAPYTPPAAEHVLADLNPAQRAAVTHPGRALLLVAGAGTGKTRALTRRVAWLVAEGVPPHAILAITFTNKAAEELVRRLDILPGGAEVWAGTFHRFGAFLLRRHGEALGIDPRFSILDREDQLGLLKVIYKELDVDAQDVRHRAMASLISHHKNGGAGRAPLGPLPEDTAAIVARVRKAYAEACRAAQLLDFDDLLLEAVRLLETAPEVARLYRDRFAHVLVDEYQDTNLVQRDLLRALVGPAQRITVVGDPDQSIYRWRGAAVSNILGFADDFEGAETLLLERNYRSTGSILAAAEAVIERNVGRHEKTLFTEREAGEPVRVLQAPDAAGEGLAVARQIRAWQQEGRRLDDIAVFYRVNALSRSIEMALREHDLPYVVVAGTEFFQRREVKDLLAYARLVVNPRDEVAFARVVNVPRRGVGARSLERLREHAAARGLALPEAAREAEAAGVSGRAKKGLARFTALLDEARSMPQAPVAGVLRRLLEGSGYRAELEDSSDVLDRARLENIDELVGYARDFDGEAEGDLATFLERAALVSDQDGWVGGTGSVSLMSVHAAKGLEFPCVIVCGAELGYFPHDRSMGEDESVEEERRLFYVAMTRARDRLVLTHAAARQTYRGREQRAPSPYLGDLPRDCVEVVRTSAAPGGAAPGSAGWDAGAGEVEVVREEGLGLEVGARVLHAYFGPGRLEALGGRGPEARVTVDFDTHGRKQLLLRHAKLERLS